MGIWPESDSNFPTTQFFQSVHILSLRAFICTFYNQYMVEFVKENKQIKHPNNVSYSIIYWKNMLIKVKTSIQLILELISDSMKMGL